LGSWSGHAGVDYAAPSGTPIQATADGIVDFIGWQNGYGNVVILRHPGNITVVYGHQSGFAPDLVKGSRVVQGQTIGYVGSTGWSTGSHLHYEFRINDKPVDPLTVALPESAPIEAQHLPEFAKAIAPLKQQLEVLAKFQPAAAEESASIAQQ
jgi:murein DD-endopeptidase MepM/ murein hydrolase activator NlpD